MVIELDNGFLIRNNITAKEYLILYLLYKKAFHQVIKYIELDPVTDEFWYKLYNTGWITGLTFKDIANLKVSKKFLSFMEKEDFFDELLKLYPVKVTRPDGEDVYLRVNQKICKNRYNRLIKNSKIKHDTVIRCLKAEIAIRTTKNTLKYMKLLPNWLKDEEYKNFEGIDTEQLVVKKPTSYGDALL